MRKGKESIIKILKAAGKGLKMNVKGSKHMTLNQRIQIQANLDVNSTCKHIASEVGMDERSVSREIKIRRNKEENGKYYAYWKDDTECKRLTKFPFVCNGCQKIRSCCKHYKYKYIAKDAQENYEIILADARSGVDFDLESKQIFDETIKNGVSNGQSIYHIIQANPDKIKCSVSKTYRLINEQKTLTQRIDLRRSVKLKPRKHYLHKEDNRAIREGRKYVDFLTEYSKTALPVVTEIDTVEGPVGQSECLLTIHITNAHFMIAIMLKEHTKECVSQAFANLRRQLGIDLYKKLFNLTLTDRGTEFCDPLAIEIDPDTGEKIANVFFCDSYASYQKGAIEENHTLLRYVIPKKAYFSGISQEQIDLVMSHINSYYRKSLGGTLYDMLKALIGEDAVQKTKIRPITPDLVNVTTKLLH